MDQIRSVQEFHFHFRRVVLGHWRYWFRWVERWKEFVSGPTLYNCMHTASVAEISAVSQSYSYNMLCIRWLVLSPLTVTMS